MASGRRVRYAIEAALVRAGLALFRALPLDVASGLGGGIARLVGPHLSISRRAASQLSRAMPELDSAAVTAAIAGMWENLGRVAGEYAHLDEFDISAANGRIELVGLEHVDRLRDDGIGGIFFSGHYGNWEILALAAGQCGVPLTMIYREANNPLVERMLRKTRAAVPGRLLPKGAAGARAAVAALLKGEHLAMLIDQKLNDGIPVPFFGRDAMTAPSLARLAMRYRVPVVPARVERLVGAHFRVTVLPPLHFTASDDKDADTLAAMTQINAMLESWIRARPDHWFWLHRRWPD
jgi:KDO2-lipid IV(A) lauroyltransferase